MERTNYNPVLGKMTLANFKKYVKKYHPNDAEKAEDIYKALKKPGKKDV